MVEQRIRNAKVVGSTPALGNPFKLNVSEENGVCSQINESLQNLSLKNYIRKNALELNSLTNLSEENFQFLFNYKIIILGEIHGINETPEMILGIIKLLSALKRHIILAIEVWDSQQDLFEKFMQTGNIELLKNSIFFKNTPQYGLGSLAMVKLLQQVRKISDVEVFCFDSFSLESKATNLKERISLSQDRDFQMAQKLGTKIKENENKTIIVITGGVHASTQINSILGFDYKPMGYWLSHAENLCSADIFSILLKFERGESFGGISKNGIDITYGVHEMDPIIDDYSQALNLDRYFLTFDKKREGHDAIFFNRKITASFPLITP